LPRIVIGPVTVAGEANPETPDSVNCSPEVELETLLYEYVTVPPLPTHIEYGNCPKLTGLPLTLVTVLEAE
jgi:hypothetical protein